MSLLLYRHKGCKKKTAKCVEKLHVQILDLVLKISNSYHKLNCLILEAVIKKYLLKYRNNDLKWIYFIVTGNFHSLLYLMNP